MKLGCGKVSKTKSNLDNLKDLKNQNYKLKMNIKSLNKKVAQEKYDNKGDDNDEYEDDDEKNWRETVK